MKRVRPVFIVVMPGNPAEAVNADFKCTLESLSSCTHFLFMRVPKNMKVDRQTTFGQIRLGLFSV